MRLALALTTSVLALGGCTLYFGGDDDPPTCGGGWADDAPPSVPTTGYYRNPETGQCQDFGYGGGGGCWYDSCGNYTCNDIAVAPPPDWASCNSWCNSYGEADCLAASGCEASYDDGYRADDLVGNDTGSGSVFAGCFETAPSGPVQGGNCYNLDAQECSRHDDCSMVYAQGFESSSFLQCVPEPTETGCTAVTCGPGSHCEQTCLTDPEDPGASCTPMCVPDEGYGCEATTCGPGYECVEQCDTMDPTAAGCFPGQCYPSCVPTTACGALPDEASCNARGDCTSVYNGDDCECYPGGYCDCQTLTWDRCEQVGDTPLPL